MVKRMSLTAADCPVARALDVIGDWWSLLIIRDAFDGLRRFTEIQGNLGIAKGMLATRLRDLVQRGVLTTAPASDGTAYKEYVLTEKGRELFPVIVALRQWGEDHLFTPGERRSVLVEAATGAPVARLALHATDGRTLDWSDTLVRQPEEKQKGTEQIPGEAVMRPSRNHPGAA